MLSRPLKSLLALLVLIGVSLPPVPTQAGRLDERPEFSDEQQDLIDEFMDNLEKDWDVGDVLHFFPEGSRQQVLHQQAVVDDLRIVKYGLLCCEVIEKSEFESPTLGKITSVFGVANGYRTLGIFSFQFRETDEALMLMSFKLHFVENLWDQH